MKKSLPAIFIFLLGIYGYTQTGINTKNPQGVFHVDGKGNNSTTEPNKNTDDFLITSEGNISSGIINPAQTEKLHINGKLKVKGSTDSYMLVSDKDGYASWQPSRIGKLVLPNGGADATRIALAAKGKITNVWEYQGVSITLSPGRWQVYFTATYENRSAKEELNIWWDLYDNENTHPNVGYIYRVLSSSAARTVDVATGKFAYAPVMAIYTVEVKDVPKTFYLWAQSKYKYQIGDLIYHGQGRMWALPIGN